MSMPCCNTPPIPIQVKGFAWQRRYVNDSKLKEGQTRSLLHGDVLSFGGPQHILQDGRLCDNPFRFTVDIQGTELAKVIAAELDGSCQGLRVHKQVHGNSHASQHAHAQCHT